MSGAFPIRDAKGLERSCDSVLWAAFEVGIGVCPPCFYTFLVEMFLAAGLLPYHFATKRVGIGSGY